MIIILSINFDVSKLEIRVYRYLNEIKIFLKKFYSCLVVGNS